MARELAVSAVNQPSKYDHAPASRRARIVARVSAVNQPSKYDHWRACGACVSLRCCLGRQPTEQVRSRSGHRWTTLPSLDVSAVNQPSKYDHACVRTSDCIWPESRPSTNRASTITWSTLATCATACESRPSTNRASTITSADAGFLAVRESRPSTNRASTITRAACRAVPRAQVSAVNQPSKYDHS